MASIPPPASFSSTGSGEPVWDLALLWPMQGTWSEFEFLQLTQGTSRLVELTSGRVEVLAMPTSSHQRILMFLLSQLNAFILPGKIGEALCAPLRVRVQEGTFREPDLVFMLQEHRSRAGEEYWQGADLVMEVVSSDAESRKRDLVQKPIDYASGGIPEYWIVDPQRKEIAVLTLSGKTYATHGVFGEGEAASSKLLSGFTVDVSAVFAAAQV